MVERTVIGEYKVYGERRVQIPTVMAKNKGIRDGDKMQWVLESGTYLLERVKDEKYRLIK